MNKYLENIIYGWLGEDNKDAISLTIAYIGVFILTFLVIIGLR